MPLCLSLYSCVQCVCAPLLSFHFYFQSMVQLSFNYHYLPNWKLFSFLFCMVNCLFSIMENNDNATMKCQFDALCIHYRWFSEMDAKFCFITLSTHICSYLWVFLLCIAFCEIKQSSKQILLAFAVVTMLKSIEFAILHGWNVSGLPVDQKCLNWVVCPFLFSNNTCCHGRY